MSRSLAAVDFEDGSRLFLIYDHTVDQARRPLFATKEAAWEWYESGSLEFAVPAGAANTELPVVLTRDLYYEGDSRWQFKSRASADAMWLTGPSSPDEAMEELRDDAPRGRDFEPG